MSQGGGHGGRIALAALAMILAAACPAAAQDGYGPTKEQWVAQADAACKDATPRFNQLVKKVNRFAKGGNPVKYGRALLRLANFLLGLREELGQIPQPEKGAGKIRLWLDTSTRADGAAKRSAKAYINRKYGRGKSSFRKASELGKEAARYGKSLGFKYC